MIKNIFPKIAPSILSSDFSQLENECKRMIEQGANYLHVDIMDGHFVPNITIGPVVVSSIRNKTDAFLDCHLMVSNPERWVEPFSKAGCSLYTFHIEATTDPIALIQSIKSRDMLVGIAIKPMTDVSTVFPYAHLVDQVLIMTVEPGFGGQSFMPLMMDKVKLLRQKYPYLDIEVDGGIGPANIDAVASAGANVIVAGTSIFSSESPRDTMQDFRNAVLKNIDFKN